MTRGAAQMLYAETTSRSEFHPGGASGAPTQEASNADSRDEVSEASLPRDPDALLMTTDGSPSPVVIRPARESEASALSDLAAEAKASWGYPDAWLAEWATALEISSALIRDDTVFVAQIERDLVGVTALQDVSGEPELAHLWVRPSAQGRGIGMALLDRIVEHLRELGIPSLRIESDPNAVPFYERCGATVVGEVPAPVCGTDRSLPVLRLSVRAFDERVGTPDSGMGLT